MDERAPQQIDGPAAPTFLLAAAVDFAGASIAVKLRNLSEQGALIEGPVCRSRIRRSFSGATTFALAQGGLGHGKQAGSHSASRSPSGRASQRPSASRGSTRHSSARQ
jgi:hypothetical protein